MAFRWLSQVHFGVLRGLEDAEERKKGGFGELGVVRPKSAEDSTGPALKLKLPCLEPWRWHLWTTLGGGVPGD